MTEHKKTDLAWVAGFIDGEGSITATFRESAKGYPSLHYRIQITSTHRPTLEWIIAEFGGVIHRGSRARSPKHKPVFYWYMSGPNAAQFLVLVEPYLRMKRRHAEIVRMLAKLGYFYRSGRGRQVDPEVTEARRPLVLELTTLNKRGAA